MSKVFSRKPIFAQQIIHGDTRLTRVLFENAAKQSPIFMLQPYSPNSFQTISPRYFSQWNSSVTEQTSETEYEQANKENISLSAAEHYLLQKYFDVYDVIAINNTYQTLTTRQLRLARLFKILMKSNFYTYSFDKHD